ncbi:MAG: hypothetical protein IT313_05660 [Anaerolineales bacterium]|nr:hypothetical protein [Anaerolineales bacterium]
MPLFEVTLSRSFIVQIQAQNAEDAVRLTEGFVGSADSSNEEDRKEHQFELRDIELVDNDAIKVNRIEN